MYFFTPAKPSAPGSDAAKAAAAVGQVDGDGRSDDLVPSEVSASYLRSRGPLDAPCRLELVPACDHFGIIDPRHAAYERVLAAIGEVAGTSPAGEPRS